MPSVPLMLVVRACPDTLSYAWSNLTEWCDLVVLAPEVRGMMGISVQPWEEAQRFMGAETAAIAVVAMMQRIGSISNPDGYLRALTGKAVAAQLGRVRREVVSCQLHAQLKNRAH